MRVLLTTVWPYPHPGGLSTYIDALRAGLPVVGCQVDVIAERRDLKAIYLIEGQGERSVEKVDIEQIVRPLWKGRPAHFRGTHKVIRALEYRRSVFEVACKMLVGSAHYDVVHAQEIISARAFFRLIGGSTPVITTLHSPLAQDYEFNGLITADDFEARRYFEVLEKLNLESSTAIIVPSTYYRSLLPVGGPETGAAIVTIPHGITVPHAARAEVTAIEHLPKRIITCVARLDPQKGIEYLLRAAARLRNHPISWEIWVIGDGPLKDSLTQLCAELGIETRVKFWGSRSDVAHLLGQTDIFVLPSVWENMPFALAEAQAAGTAIIATNVGGIPEVVVDHNNGLLVPARSSDALEQAMATLLSDDALRTNLALNARESSSQLWDTQRMIRATVDVYCHAVGKQPGRTWSASSVGTPDEEIFRELTQDNGQSR